MKAQAQLTAIVFTVLIVGLVAATFLSNNGINLKFDGFTAITGMPVATPTSCGDVSSSLTLTSNVNVSSGDCFNITADNVVLDCNGYLINCTGSCNYGIWLNSRNNVTVKNCNIKKYSRGIYVYGSNLTIYNNNITETTDGIQATGYPSGNLLNISKNKINSTNNGINLAVTANSHISDNIICGLNHSLYFGGYAPHNYVYNNTILNSTEGIHFIYTGSGSPSENLIDNNNFSNNVRDILSESGYPLQNIARNDLMIRKENNFLMFKDKILNISKINNNIFINDSIVALNSSAEPVMNVSAKVRLKVDSCENIHIIAYENFTTNKSLALSNGRLCDYCYNVNCSDNIVEFDTTHFSTLVANSGCVVPTNGMSITQSVVLCNGTYNLPNGIKVNASNIIIECNNTKLNGSINSYGFYNYFDNVTISGCTIQNHGIGIFAVQSTTIINNTIINSSNSGIILSTNNKLLNNFIFNSNTNGIYVSFNNTLINNTINKTNEAGIRLIGSNNSIINNLIISSGLEGLKFENSQFNLISNNTLLNNSIGFNIDNSNNNSIEFYTNAMNNTKEILSVNSNNTFIINEIQNKIKFDYKSINLTSLKKAVYLNKSIIAINSSLEPSLNTSANIILEVDSCPSYIVYRDGFWKNISDINGYGAICDETNHCHNINCTDNTLTFNVDRFSSYAAVPCVIPFFGMTITSSTIFCPGSYDLSYSSELNKDTAIIINASNVAILCNNTILNGKEFTNSSFPQRELGIFVSGKNISLIGCTVNGYSYGILLRANNSDLLNNSLINNSMGGITLQHSINNTIKNNSFFNNGGINEAVDIFNSTNTNITKNLFVNNPMKSIECRYYSNNCHITENKFLFGNMHLKLDLSFNNSVINNIFENASQYSILNYRTTDNKIINNTIKGSQDSILVVTSNDSTIENNTIYNSSSGNLFYEAFNITSKNNLIYDISDKGLNLRNSKNCYILQNIIRNSTNSGIYIDNSTGFLFMDNDISMSGKGIDILNSENNVFYNQSTSKNLIDFFTRTNSTNTLYVLKGKNEILFYKKILNITDMNNIFITDSLAAVNTSAEPAMNTSANISFVVPNCNIKLYKSLYFSKIKEITEPEFGITECDTCSDYVCVNNIANFSVSEFSTVFADVVPAITEIYPNATGEKQTVSLNDTNVTTETLLRENKTFNVTVEDIDSNLITVKWFVDAVLKLIDFITTVLGKITSSFTFNFTTGGMHNVTAEVSDVLGSKDTFQFNVNVSCENDDSDGDGFYKTEGCGILDCDDTNPNMRPPRDNETINNNLIYCPGTYKIPNGIQINKSNIVLICNNTTFEGNVSSSVRGIYANNLNNITIIGCRITNYFRGIHLQRVTNSTLKDNFAFKNNHGLYLHYYSEGNLLLNNTFENNTQNAFYIAFNVNNNYLTNNTFKNNNMSIWSDPSSNNTLAVFNGPNKIVFENKNINLKNLSNIYINDSIIAVNTQLEPGLNLSAKITFNVSKCPQNIYYNNTFLTNRDAVIAQNNLCPSNICHNITCSNKTLNFIVERFSTYAANATPCIAPEDGMIINESVNFCSGTYNLPNGITVNRSNIIINCQDTLLNGSGNNYGISLYQKLNVSIIGCSISNYEVAIRPTYSNDLIIKNNNLINNEKGIYCGYSLSLNISNNSIYGNNVGLQFAYSPSNKINENIFENNTLAIDFTYSSDSNISNNLFLNNEKDINSILSLNNLIISNNSNKLEFNSALLNITKINNFFLNNSIVAVNTSAEPGLNLSANITLNVSSCPAPIYFKEGFFTTREDVIFGGTICDDSNLCHNINCTDNILTFNIDHFSSYAAGCIEPTDGMVINSSVTLCPGTYNLPNGIKINASNIELKCDNTVLNGTGANIGINISRLLNVSISACTIQKFSLGIYVYNSSNINLSKNIIKNNTDSCIISFYSSNSTISNNNINNGYRGIFLQFSSNITTAYNNISHNNNDGIILYFSSNMTVLNNNIINNSHYGINSYASSKNVISENIINNNSRGIFLEFSSNNKLLDNSLINNSNDIVTITVYSNNTLTLTKNNNQIKFENKFINITDIDNIFINDSLVALNSSAEPAMNTSANISFYVSSCNATLMQADGFYRSIDEITSATPCTTCHNITCADNIMNFTTEHFSTIFAYVTPKFTSIYPNATNKTQPRINETNVSFTTEVGTNITFNVSGQAVANPFTVEWFINGISKFIEMVSGFFTSIFSFFFNESGEYNITVRVNDSLASDEFMFNVTSVCVDNDGDGFNRSGYGCGPVDCNDNDYNVIPPADRMSINRNVTFCPGIYNLPNGILINNSGIKVICNNTVFNGVGSNLGIDLQNNNNSIVESCNVQNYSFGIYLSNSENNKLVHNEIRNCGVGVDYSYVTSLTIDSNVIYNVGKGMLATYSSNMNITNNIFENMSSADYAIDVGGSASNILISGNIFRNLEGTAIHLFGDNNIIKNNIFSNIGDTSLYYNSGSNNTFIENYFFNSTNFALKLEGTTDSLILNNGFINNGVGIYINKYTYPGGVNNATRNIIDNNSFTSNKNDINTNMVGVNNNTLIIRQQSNKITFYDKEINISKINNIYINTKIAALNSSAEPHMNQSAEITFTGLNNPTTPKIYRYDGFTTNRSLALANGYECNESNYCYDMTYSLGTLKFNVTGFSTYVVPDYVPPYQPPSGGGGGAGGGGGIVREEKPSVSIPTPYTCIEDWTCTEWSECSPEGKKTRVCTDKSKCRTTYKKPAEEESCIYVKPTPPVQPAPPTPPVIEKPVVVEKTFWQKLFEISPTWILTYVGIGILILAILIPIIVATTRHKIKPTAGIELRPEIAKPEQIERRAEAYTKLKELEKYILHALANGFKKEEVKSKLISKGWPEHIIDEIMKKL